METRQREKEKRVRPSRSAQSSASYSSSSITTFSASQSAKRVRFNTDEADAAELAERSSTESEPLNGGSDLERRVRNKRVQTEAGEGARAGDHWHLSSSLGENAVVAYTDALNIVREASRRFTSSTTVQSIMAYLRRSDELPKTGYTYANGLGYDPLGPSNPPMPNMSRYSLDHYADTGASYNHHLSSHATIIRRRFDSESEESIGRIREADDLHTQTQILPHSFASHQQSYQHDNSSSLQKYLTSIYRRVVTRTVTTQQDRHEHDGQTEPEEHLQRNNAASSSITVSGRVSPESRSGNDYDGSYGEISGWNTSERSLSRFLSGSRTQSPYYWNGDGDDRRLFSSSDHNLTRFLMDSFRKPILYIVARAKSLFLADGGALSNRDFQRERGYQRRTSLMCCWCLPLLLLLFLLPALLGLIDRSEKENTPYWHSFMHSYRSLPNTLWTFMSKDKTRESHFYYLNTTNISQTELEALIDSKIAQFKNTRNCCDDMATLRSQMASVLVELQKLHDLRAEDDVWRRDRETREDKSRIALEELRDLVMALQETVHSWEMERKDVIIPQVTEEKGNFSLEDIRLLVSKMIRLYDEDKTGQPDHALESAGGSVISTRCTEEYKWGHAQYSIFGIPIWTWTTSPRLAIQADMRPGQCWAFKGHEGLLVVKLSGIIRPTAFTLEHLSKNLSPTGKIDSAPRHFQIYGLVSEQGPGHLLGEYEYFDNDQPLQTFSTQIKLESDEGFSYVELRILSNHGNPDYTCLYRFRVHGRMLQRGS